MQEMQSSNCRRYGIMAQMWVVSAILLLTIAVFNINAEQHIELSVPRAHFADDGLQAEPAGPMTHSDDAQRHSLKLATYKKELLGCPHTAKKIMLSLILRTNSWDDIIDNKRDRALSKLSKLFNVPKDSMVTTNIIQREISEMEKNSVQKGQHVPKSDRKRFGKLEFVIGCSDYFTTGSTIAKRMSRQMEENLISEASGLNFDWWCIWEKQPNYRTPRSKRDTDNANDGLGEEDDDDDYYYDDENETPDEPVTEVKPAVEEHDEHPHRHHHGDESSSLDVTQPTLPSSSSSSLSSSSTATFITTKIISQETPYISTTSKLNADTTESQSTTFSTTVGQVLVNSPVSVTNKIESVAVTNVPSSSSESITTETSLRTSEVTAPKVTLPAKSNVAVVTSSTQPSNAVEDTFETTDSGQYDESEYDDDDYDDDGSKISVATPTTQKATTPITTIPIASQETTIPERTTVPIVTTSSTALPTTTVQPTTTTEAYVEPENINNAPVIKARLMKLPVTAGKTFNQIVPLDTFYDAEDGTNLKLELLDKHEKPLEAKSWIQFNPDTRSIYGLPLEDAVSKWQFKLRATDNANESVVESLDITVQQHKAYRSVNHEIIIAVNLLTEFASNVDWEMHLIKGIVDTLGDTSTSSVLVRDIRYGIQDSNAATFIYTNESLPKDVCPEMQLNEITAKLTPTTLSNAVSPQMSIKSIEGKTIGTCSKPETVKPTAPKPTPHMMKNYPPIARNQVDRVNATINQLLVFKVPSDTFYDPEDGTDLELNLLTYERSKLDPKYWLQFDSKNQEFYGVPKFGDAGQREYVLVAEDKEGLQASDALVVVVSQPPHREYSTAFEFTLNMPYEDFNNSLSQRRFIERIAQIYNDPTTSNIQIRSIRKIHQTGSTYVTFFNTTLHRPHNVCPTEEIDTLKNILLHKDGSIRSRVKDIIGNEFDLVKIHLAPTGPCLPTDQNKVLTANIPIKPDDSDPLNFKDDHLLTFILPAVIILAMLFLTCIIACVLHRRRMTGKMELAGDEEERRAFRSKGIPVIFQDELDEKPEIGNKSPIILKDEKPPLLPPSYNSTNPDDHEDLEDYIPPPAVAMSGRESRGKSPVTPSYRKPPPYVSP
ncbi:uncharacterized protein LOC129578779 isoform X4 [Sitodiplosis mosellana]|uniref:uncharacterized protein LOC129578779 isoform X4 n=1 Tax=Sitodiplosis mosellana TaxID=263140 RepID=UPI0024440FAE|nr:uncharacterized protein LOC129578779 isoform X4 [Sitodiplosis mosellana]XP_055323854.1 uncharacterized protein LOC129578779 isoform X4 [Sitodiplosis mosellana]XP_055323855.1 uncharacterized protein LOC129578779 isoform X4 [Sitodiplosis mosellana]XP_055323856.1 uncharacterized protein LOC129578779 isoform X4 [Sitodiplosis mosellana]